MDLGARAHGMCGARRHMRGMIFELCPGAIDAMSLFPALARRRQTNRRMRDLVQSREDKRGLLIAFEGPDGSGKTTQRKLFKNWLKSEGHDVVTTKWNSSALVKPLVKARKAARSLSPEEFSLLHAADFRYRLETDVLPALWNGQTVVADRYLFTALARDAARGLDLHWLMELYRPLFWPDIVFYFSVSPETSGKRIAAERSPNYYEAGQDVTEIEDPLNSYMHVHRAGDSGVRSAGQGIPVCDSGCRAIDLRPAPPDSCAVFRWNAAPVAGLESGSAGGVVEPSPGGRGTMTPNGTVKGRLIALEGSGGRPMAVAAKMLGARICDCGERNSAPAHGTPPTSSFRLRAGSAGFRRPRREPWCCYMPPTSHSACAGRSGRRWRTACP